MAALLIDWLMCYAIAIGFFSGSGTIIDRAPNARFPVLVIFFLELLVLTSLGGASFGHRALKMKVVRFSDGGAATRLQALIRTTLICLVVTAITFDENGRGLHERLSNTKLINS